MDETVSYKYSNLHNIRDLKEKLFHGQSSAIRRANGKYLQSCPTIYAQPRQTHLEIDPSNAIPPISPQG